MRPFRRLEPGGSLLTCSASETGNFEPRTGSSFRRSATHEVRCTSCDFPLWICTSTCARSLPEFPRCHASYVDSHAPLSDCDGQSCQRISRFHETVEPSANRVSRADRSLDGPASGRCPTALPTAEDFGCAAPSQPSTATEDPHSTVIPSQGRPSHKRSSKPTLPAIPGADTDRGRKE
jgi:hypothetical protein